MLAQLADLRLCALMSLRPYVCALTSLRPFVCALLSAPFCLRPYVVDRKNHNYSNLAPLQILLKNLLPLLVKYIVKMNCTVYKYICST